MAEHRKMMADTLTWRRSREYVCLCFITTSGAGKSSGMGFSMLSYTMQNADTSNIIQDGALRLQNMLFFAQPGHEGLPSWLEGNKKM